MSGLTAVGSRTSDKKRSSRSSRSRSSGSGEGDGVPRSESDHVMSCQSTGVGGADDRRGRTGETCADDDGEIETTSSATDTEARRPEVSDRETTGSSSRSESALGDAATTMVATELAEATQRGAGTTEGRANRCKAGRGTMGAA